MENSLQHYGILGMKWGRRRYQNKDGSLTPEGKARRSKSTRSQNFSEDYINAHSKKKVSEMSNAELREKINRIQMEKQYSQLTMREKSTGEKMVREILTNAAKQTATNYISRYMSKSLETIFDSIKNKLKK